jgi:peptidoglycan/LPS O-acetylase OafA/YrhL
MALVLRVATPRRFIIGSAMVVTLVIIRKPSQPLYLVAFGGGIVAAYLARFDKLRVLARNRWSSMLVVILVGGCVTLFPTSYNLLCLTLLSIAFIIIAAGNTVFGVLAWEVSRVIGEVTYSVYLLHGIILFYVFRFLIGFGSGASYSVAKHWSVMFGCIPVVLAMACATFRFIELPTMRSVGKLALWLQEKRIRFRSLIRSDSKVPESKRG